MNNSNFWLSDIKILINNNSFLPNKNMSRNDLLNLFTKYGIIIFLIIYIFNFNKKFYNIPSIIIIVCISLFFLDKKDIKNINKIKCKKPNINNPYMNILVTENKNNLPACNYDNNKNLINKYYNLNSYRNAIDIFNNKNFERQFYTMPVSTIPNKQNDFVDWLYKIDDNCKNNNAYCKQYEDERYH